MECWVEQAAELLKPVYRSVREDFLRGNCLQADEMAIRQLPGAKIAQINEFTPAAYAKANNSSSRFGFMAA